MKKRSHPRADESNFPPKGAGTPVVWFGPGGPTDETDGRVAQITAMAIQIFGSRDKAERWLRRPLREFGDICPLEMLETPAGAHQVELLLDQLAAGG